MPIDVSDKIIKSFKRASLDATISNLEPFNIDSFKATTSLSFKDHQRRATDKEIHLVSNPKHLTFELKVTSVFALFTLVNKIEDFISNAPEAALCAGSLFSDSVKRQVEAYSSLHKPDVNGKSWSSMTVDEAILRCRLIAAPINKGAIIMELQNFRSAFGNVFSMSPDKLVNA